MVPIKTGFDRSALSHFHACRVLKKGVFCPEVYATNFRFFKIFTIFFLKNLVP